MEFRLPDCLASAYQAIYPNIDWTRVHFAVGIPTLLNKGQPAITQQSYSDQTISFRDDVTQDFCSEETFLLIAHELVHVLQIQNSLGGGYIPGSWVFNYVTCYTLGGFTDTAGNCYEDEAYLFSNANFDHGYSQKGLLRDAIDSGKLALPCTCSSPSSFGLPAPAMPAQQFSDSVVRLHLQKFQAHCDIRRCMGEFFNKLGPFAFLLAPVIFVMALLAMIFTIGGINTGTLVGLGIGGIGGFVLGAAAGAFLGFLGAILVGALFGFLGAFLGGLIGSLLQDLFDAIFGGDSGGGINLVSGNDVALNFPGSRVTFEHTREQVALALGAVNLWVAWAGTDNQVNVMTLQKGAKPNKVTFEQINNCGPALAFDPSSNALVVCWQGFDGRLNFRLSTDFGLSFNAGKITFGPQGPADATPGILFLNSFLYMAWIGSGNKLNLWGFSGLWSTSIFQRELSATTFGQGTAAIAAASNGRVFLAYLDAANASPVLEVYQQTPSGDLIAISKHYIDFGIGPEIADDATGPALAYDEVLGRIMISWIGNNNSDIILGFSDDGVTFNTRTVLVRDPKGPSFEQSRGNTGPALLAAGNRIVWVWTGRA